MAPTDILPLAEPAGVPAEEDLRALWARNLKAARKAAGYGSTYALADASGVPQQTVSLIERGGLPRERAHLYRLARALGVEVYELFPFPPVKAAS